MTLIECFSKSDLENVAGCLLLPVEKLILLGDKGMMEEPARRYRTFFQKKSSEITIELRDTRMHFKELTKMLRSTVLAEGACTIALAGGDEMTLMAIGAMLAGLDEAQRANVSVQRFDPESGTMRDCSSGRITAKSSSVSLSVGELIALHGGTVFPDTYQPAEDCVPSDLDEVWKLASADPRKWNQMISALAEFEKRSESKTEIFLPLDELCSEGIGDFESKEKRVRTLLKALAKQGLIEDNSSHKALSYTYTSDMARFCTRKAGNVLEVKTLLETRALREAGVPRFDDCRMGVSIDWDGVVHDPMEAVPDTKNEIDVIATAGLMSLFISCKNGDVDEDELYKLQTVADHFGGPYVRKMLIATDMDAKRASARRALSQRAWDMDIILVTDAGELSAEEWCELFRRAMQ